ncbi:MAG: hypothetical protein WAN43_12585 [Rhodomicrobium sp.]|jgi:hypothetical protein
MVVNYRVAASAACLLIAVQARAAETPPLADLLAAKPTDAGIDVTVTTGGCTKKADFAVSAQPPAQGAAKVEIRRLKSDWCKGNFPDGIKLTFTWEELKLPAGTKLSLANPVAGQAAQAAETRKASVAAPRKFKKRCKRRARHARCGKRRAHGASRAVAHRAHVRRHHRRRHRAHCEF